MLTHTHQVVEKFKFKNPVYTHAMSVSSTHTLAAVGGGECKVTLCDLVSGASTHVLESHLRPVMSLAWSTGCEHVLASGRCVCVREREREREREGEGEGEGEGGRNCSSHSQDNRVVVWDIRKANGPLMTLDQHNGGSGASNNASGIEEINSSSAVRLRMM